MVMWNSPRVMYQISTIHRSIVNFEYKLQYDISVVEAADAGKHWIFFPTVKFVPMFFVINTVFIRSLFNVQNIRNKIGYIEILFLLIGRKCYHVFSPLKTHRILGMSRLVCLLLCAPTTVGLFDWYARFVVRALFRGMVGNVRSPEVGPR
jgi:hypothetical protein